MTKAFSSASALVLGGGVIGLFTALALHRAGFQVRLLERGLIGRQASWAGGGILSPLYPWRAPAAVWELAADSQRVYPEICAELAQRTGIDPEWTRSGMAILDHGQRAEALRWSARVGVEVADGQFSSGPAAPLPALWLPWVAQVRNPRLCRALRVLIEQAGVRCEDQQGELRLCGEGGQATVVDPQGHQYSADVVVVTAGAWSGSLLRAVDWELSIQPVMGQMILLRGALGLLPHIVLRVGRYLIPRRDGRILVGSTVEPDAGFNARTSETAAVELRDFARALLPPGAPVEVEQHWAGIRPGTVDECPIIAQHPRLQNLYVNAGHYRNGLTLAPASAERLLSLVLAAQRQPLTAGGVGQVG